MSLPARTLSSCPGCRQPAKHYARGLCRDCYWRNYRETHRIEHRARAKAARLAMTDAQEKRKRAQQQAWVKAHRARMCEIVRQSKARRRDSEWPLGATVWIRLGRHWCPGRLAERVGHGWVRVRMPGGCVFSAPYRDLRRERPTEAAR